MKPHRLELADVFRTHQHHFLARWNSVLSRQQRKALRDIRDCQTPVLGGHLYECDRCGHRVKVFNSCRNRSCPKCQATARATSVLPSASLPCCTPGVRTCIFIRTCIASCLAADPLPTAAAGSPAGKIPSSFLIKFSAVSSANSSFSPWERLFAKVGFTSPASF